MQIAAFISLLPVLAAASPLQARDTSPGALSLTAIHSGSPLQYQPISATDGGFFIGKTTHANSCPDTQCNLPINVTGVLVDNNGQARMASQVSTQSLFVSGASSALSYEAAHSNTAGSSDVLDGFEYLSPQAGHSYGSLSFHSNNPAYTGFWACQQAQSSDVYQIMLSDTNNCVSIDIATLNLGTEVTAWTY